MTRDVSVKQTLLMQLITQTRYMELINGTNTWWNLVEGTIRFPIIQVNEYVKQQALHTRSGSKYQGHPLDTNGYNHFPETHPLHKLKDAHLFSTARVLSRPASPLSSTYCSLLASPLPPLALIRLDISNHLLVQFLLYNSMTPFRSTLSHYTLQIKCT